MRYIGLGLLFFVLVIGIAFLLGFPMMWLVNYLFAPSFLVTVFGATQLTFWKAFWLNIFFGIFLSSNHSSK
jgi:hypothetical protein